eukprot:SAG11_NODE_1208_length_5521_cov_4.088528_9_plen_235_part_00
MCRLAIVQADHRRRSGVGMAAPVASEIKSRLVSKDKLSKKYKTKQVLGRGSQATVNLAVHKKTGEQCAVKVYEKKHPGFVEAELMLECEAMSRCSHPYVIGFKSLHEQKKVFEVLLEFCPGGEWRDVIIARRKENGMGPPYTEAEAKPLMKQLLEAVKYCNQQGLCHRDLKPENILVVADENGDVTLKLTDFGLVAMVSSTEDLINNAGAHSLHPLPPPLCTFSFAYVSSPGAR